MQLDNFLVEPRLGEGGPAAAQPNPRGQVMPRPDMRNSCSRKNKSLAAKN